MDNRTDEFFRLAREIKLSPEENAALSEKVRSFVRENPVREGGIACHTERMAKNPLETGKEVHLTSLEKAEGFAALQTFMRSHPVRESGNGFFEKLNTMFSSMHRTMAGAVAILLLVGAGGTVSFAAEGAEPEDFLYPVKVGFTEPLRIALTVNAEAKAELRIKHLRRRFAEAKSLSEKKEVRAEIRERLETRIQSSMERIEAHIAVLESSEEEGAEEVSSRYSAALEAQEMVLLKLEANMDIENTERPLRPILERVKEARMRVKAHRESLPHKGEGRGQIEAEGSASADMEIDRSSSGGMDSSFSIFSSRERSNSSESSKIRIFEKIFPKSRRSSEKSSNESSAMSSRSISSASSTQSSVSSDTSSSARSSSSEHSSEVSSRESSSSSLSTDLPEDESEPPVIPPVLP